MMTAAPLSSACQPGDAGSLPAQFHGRWFLEAISGGLEGSTVKDESGAYIVVHANRIELFAPEARERTETFTARLSDETIFSTDRLWTLEYEPNRVDVIRLIEDGRRLTISENAYDAVNRHYVRERTP
jgi:hypothetical protein